MKITTKGKLQDALMAAAQGAMGHCEIDFDEGDDNPLGMLSTMGLEEWFRWIQSVEKLFSGAVYPPVFELYNLHKFEHLSGAVDLMWSCRKP